MTSMHSYKTCTKFSSTQVSKCVEAGISHVISEITGQDGAMSNQLSASSCPSEASTRNSTTNTETIARQVGQPREAAAAHAPRFPASFFFCCCCFRRTSVVACTQRLRVGTVATVCQCRRRKAANALSLSGCLIAWPGPGQAYFTGGHPGEYVDLKTFCYRYSTTTGAG